MTRLEQIRLKRNEEKVARIIAVPIVLVLSILFYLGKLILALLWKVRRALWKLSVTISIVFFLTNVFGVVANAPKANATAPVIPVKEQTQKDQIKAYIRKVFGKYGDQAIRVATCESGLNPRAVNDNTQWGGVGVDRGTFQLNSVYQGISNTNFLFDYRLNTDMAYIIFKNAGYNWHLWTCGRKLGL
jgi:hypothetical protein